MLDTSRLFFALITATLFHNAPLASPQLGHEAAQESAGHEESGWVASTERFLSHELFDMLVDLADIADEQERQAFASTHLEAVCEDHRQYIRGEPMDRALLIDALFFLDHATVNGEVNESPTDCLEEVLNSLHKTDSGFVVPRAMLGARVARHHASTGDSAEAEYWLLAAWLDLAHHIAHGPGDPGDAEIADWYYERQRDVTKEIGIGQRHRHELIPGTQLTVKGALGVVYLSSAMDKIALHQNESQGLAELLNAHESKVSVEGISSSTLGVYDRLDRYLHENPVSAEDKKRIEVFSRSYPLSTKGFFECRTAHFFHALIASELRNF